jgi:RHS repeat-associated protein
MPDGTTYEYTYDNNNKISMISIPGQGSLTFNKYKWNMPETITLPGGTKKDNAYTPLMELKSSSVRGPAQNLLMSYNYEYSPAGSVKTKNTEHGNYAYQYDELYRLTGSTNPAASTESYTYDAVGNRLISADVQGTWSYNTNNELLGYGDASYEYDFNGNTIRKTDQSGITTYTYDVDNRLIQIRNPQSAIYNYYYDPFGKRLWKEVDGVGTYFFYSDEGLIGEYGSTGNEIRTYGYAPDSDFTTKPLFQKMGTNYYWYHNDHLGTPQKVVDTNGRIVWSATYSAFGNIQVTAAEIENNLRFPGQYYDQETGLHYNYHRYYDFEIGRYMAADPIGLGGGINVYAYVLNNPINSIDPLGLWIPSIHRSFTRQAAISSECAKASDELANATAGVDSEGGSQRPDHAFWHGMVDGTKPRERRVEDIKAYLDLVEKGRSSCDTFDIAHALHALQDFYAPAHGSKPWNGGLLGNIPHLSDFFVLPWAYEVGSASRDLLAGIRGRCPCLCQ